VSGNKVHSIAHIDFKQSLDLAVLATFVNLICQYNFSVNIYYLWKIPFY
jgi:hypothetical protein